MWIEARPPPLFQHLLLNMLTRFLWPGPPSEPHPSFDVTTTPLGCLHRHLKFGQKRTLRSKTSSSRRVSFQQMALHIPSSSSQESNASSIPPFFLLPRPSPQQDPVSLPPNVNQICSLLSPSTALLRVQALVCHPLMNKRESLPTGVEFG